MFHHAFTSGILYLFLGRGTLAKIDKSDPTTIFRPTKTSFRNLPEDWDWNFHLNNQFTSPLKSHSNLSNRSHFKMSDLARFNISFGMWPVASIDIVQRKFGIGLGAVSARFLREIPIFAKFFVY